MVSPILGQPVDWCLEGLDQLQEIIDRVLEDIGIRISSYRDTRWSEREEVNRQIIESKVLSERANDLIRKSCSQ